MRPLPPLAAALALAWLALAPPGLGLGPPAGCGALGGSALPAPGDVVAAAARAGLDLALAEPLGPAPLHGDATREAAEAHPCAGKIRPGAALVIQDAYLCTANWVLRDDRGDLYLGTAGHCMPPWATRYEVVGLEGDIGDAAYVLNQGPGADFGLLRIDPSFHGHVEPTLCHWGGPTALGAFDPEAALPPESLALHYGWGYPYGAHAEARARAGHLPGLFWFEGWPFFEVAVGPGDSGSPLGTHDGHAAAVITHTVLAPGPLPPAGLLLSAGTRLDHGMAWAGAATGRSFELVPSMHPVDLTGLSIP